MLHSEWRLSDGTRHAADVVQVAWNATRILWPCACGRGLQVPLAGGQVDCPDCQQRHDVRHDVSGAEHVLTIYASVTPHGPAPTPGDGDG